MMREDRMRHEDALEALLIAAAKEEAPSPTAEERVLAALGVTGAALSLPLSAAQAANAKGVSLSWKLLAKILGGCAVGGAVALGFARAPMQSDPPMARRTGSLGEVVRRIQPAVAAEMPAPDLPVASEPTVTSVNAPTKTSEPPVRSAPGPLMSLRSASTPPEDTNPSLEAEVRALDEARQALRNGQPARALALLNQYTSQFPKPILGSEATAMRVEALAQNGDAAAARILANRFLKANPKSPLANRVRSTAGAPSSGSP